jgi:ABC-2 type transport system permease protein
MFLVLLKQKALSVRNSFDARILIRKLPFIGIGIGSWLLIYNGTYKVLSFARGMGFMGEALSETLFSMVFFGLTGFMILSNVITALSSFYLSDDIPFLLSRPVETRDIISMKSVESFVHSSWMVIIYTPAVFIAYGVIYRATAWYFITIHIAFFAFLSITLSVGIVIAHILTRVFPAQRSRTVLLGISVVLFLILYFIVKSTIRNDLSNPKEIINSLINFRSYSPLLPGSWIMRAVFPLLRNKGLDFFYAGVLLSNALFSLLLSSLIGAWFYRGNIEKIQPSGMMTGRFSGRFYPGLAIAFLYKDTKVFFRDRGQWSQVFIIGALIMVYIYNFNSIPIATISGLLPFGKELMVLINMVMAGLVLSAVSGRFLFPSVSLEGKAFWVIKTSPLDMNRFLWSKFLCGCIPLTCLIIPLVLVTNSALHVKGPLMVICAVTALILCISVSGLGTGMGAIYPNFNYKNIASVSTGIGGMAFMLIAFCVVLITVLLESRIFYLHAIRLETAATHVISWKMQSATCFVLIGVINAAAFYLPMKMGGQKLIAWNDIVS